jgi:hypothetical protein
VSASAFTYGVFAIRLLKCGEYTQPLQPLSGEVVPITDAEQRALSLAGADFSVLVLDMEEVSSLRVPAKGPSGRKSGRELKRASCQGVYLSSTMHADSMPTYGLLCGWTRRT